MGIPDCSSPRRYKTGARALIGGSLFIAIVSVLAGCAFWHAPGNDATGESDNGAPSAATLEQQADALEATPEVAGRHRQKRLAEALAAIYAGDGTAQGLHYVADFADLNDDGQADAVAFVFRNGSCTDGCDLFLFKQEGERFVVINRIPTARPPLYRLNKTDDGWHDLLTTTIDDAGGSDRQQLQYADGGYSLVDDDRTVDAHRTPLITDLSSGVHPVPTSRGSGQ